MITWLASYPRSGNTLLRIVLNCCFGLTSQSIYSDAEFRSEAVRNVVGHEPVGADPNAFIRKAIREARGLYVKTHELPGKDSHPAIYIVRDGRSSIISHYHFAKDVLRRDVTLAEIVEGKLGPSWSFHVSSWAFSQRPHTLVVRFEDLVSADPRTLESIAAFIRRPILRELSVSFDQLRVLDPYFFRSGSDRANLAELDLSTMELFSKIHGDTLRQLGYTA